MPTKYTKALNVPVAVAVGTTLDARELGQVQVLIVVGAFIGTYELQASPNAVDWVKEGADITTPVIRGVLGAPYYRLNCTAFTSAPTSAVIHTRNG